MSKTAKIIFGVVLVVIVALALYFLINSLSRTARGRGLFSVLCAIMLNKHIAEHGSARVALHIAQGSYKALHLPCKWVCCILYGKRALRRTSIG